MTSLGSRLISVVIPSFSRDVETRLAVESAVSRHSALVEIIVVDDASQVPFRYTGRNNRAGIPVRVLRLDKNAGPGIARGLGVSNAKGEFVAFLDSDDRFSQGWMDSVVEFLLSLEPSRRTRGLILVGEASGGKTSHRLIRDFLARQSNSLIRKLLTQIVSIVFNPFYTPTLVVSRSICRFHPSLRYCEDYFTFVEAAFRAQEIHYLPSLACQLSRSPSEAGGLSSARRRMFQGELKVRGHVLASRDFPVYAKLLVPVGVFYQILRETMRATLRGVALVSGKLGRRKNR